MSHIYFTPGRALTALASEATEGHVLSALYAVIAELPDELTGTDDMSSRELADLIFTILMEGSE